ncbi:DUF3850 domain-containing protein [Listeria costaricensis]|uniref:DUF3850 domain-containing protein n=1 Tax=Listeria costaricensis TaxID=2026604 RepID=UPI0013C50437|nr:DUF3850 domain-containing protein [Listeria costaricensis]
MKSRLEKEKFGNSINELRLAKGLTLEEFGALFNPSATPSIVSKWERGISLPAPEQMAIILQMFGKRLRNSIDIHELKIAPRYFKDILYQHKRFENRINDRNYKVGDLLMLKEFDQNGYTGNKLYVRVTYMTDAFTKDDYVCLGFEVLNNIYHNITFKKMGFLVEN